ncbi:phosphate ABC transporter ATP-binding protein PstB [Radicibacter daui]|uniref:phosphate ABC transporter ATP-binding protein PstB n=1 Tax=Radicibacter daui TaxID=3064829 RepID=UPI004046F03B
MANSSHAAKQDHKAEAAPHKAAVLELKKLCFFYGTQQSLFDVNLTFHRGQVTALMGPSGCGKSTLIRSINRIYELYPNQRAAGEVLFHGANVLEPGIDVNDLRLKIGMVFQKPTPFPMTIFENVAFGLKRHYKMTPAEIEERVEWALTKSALWSEVKDKLHKAGTALSGGQQQRLCIARTVALKPEVLLLDEPTSALDPLSTVKIEELVRELRQDFTIILVSHNVNQARRISDETVFMEAGRVVEVRKTSELFGSPKDQRTKIFIESF